MTLIAPSGSEKTATLIDLATQHFVIYCVCSTSRATAFADFNNPNFIGLAADIEKMDMAIVDKE